jgi:hypothetical protein
MGIHTAFEIQHPGARLAFGSVTQLRPRWPLSPPAFAFSLRFMPHFLLRTVSSAPPALPSSLILLAKIGYPQFAALFLALGQVDDNSGNNRNGDDNGRDFGQKQAILSK